MKILRKLAALFRKEKLDAEMSEEMRLHLEMQAERNRAAGMNENEARYAALRQFGNVAVIQEQAREGRGWVWLEQFGQDLRFAVRMLWKTPGVTITAVLTLGLGIGVNAVLFTVYDIAVLRPLPSREPDELVDIRGRNEKLRASGDSRFSYPDYLDYCAGTQAFSDLVAVREVMAQLPNEVPSVEESPLEPSAGVVLLQAVSGNYFSALGAEIVLGRDFLPEEAGPHAGRPVMVVSHLFWQTHLKGDPNVLGRTLTTQHGRSQDRMACTIIGVAAPDFVGQSVVPPAGWIPLTANPVGLEDRTRRQLTVIGRMRAGITAPQAKADLDAITQRLEQLYPEERRANSVMLQPGMRLFTPSLNPGIALAMSPVLLGFGLVLVIACLNVANLLLARGVARQHEIGVRLVLGAGRGRLVRQLFAENCLLCLLGAGAALLLAVWTLQALKPVVMSMLAWESQARTFVSMIEIGLDWRIAGFGAILAVVAAVTAGLAPALHSVQRDGMFALKQDGTAFGRKMTPTRLRNLLLVGQVAVCLALLAVSGLMTGRALRAGAAEGGLSVDGVYEVRPPASAGLANSWASDLQTSVEALRTMPGVASACLVWQTPRRKPGGNGGVMLTKLPDGKPAKTTYNQVSAGFFETFGVPILRGRAFTAQEAASAARVVILTEGAARWLWPGEEAVGKILLADAAMLRRPGEPSVKLGQNFRECMVIGVARDFRSNWSIEESERLVLFPGPQKGDGGNIFVRLQADSTAMLRGVERASAAAGVPVQFRERHATIADRGMGPLRAFAWISVALTGLALSLATVGLYGVMAFVVNQRVKEIGVRMALGATTGRVTGLFVRQGMRLVAWGVGLGLAGGMAFAALLAKALPGAQFAGEPGFRVLVFAVVTTFLAAVALLACWLPARRAARIDPMVALRAE